MTIFNTPGMLPTSSPMVRLLAPMSLSVSGSSRGMVDSISVKQKSPQSIQKKTPTRPALVYTRTRVAGEAPVGPGAFSTTSESSAATCDMALSRLHRYEHREVPAHRSLFRVRWLVHQARLGIGKHQLG